MRKALRTCLFALALVAILAASMAGFLLWCQLPDHDYSLVVRGLDAEEQIVARTLETHVRMLASDIGPRNLNRWPENLAKAAGYIEAVSAGYGLPLTRHTFQVGSVNAVNLYAEIPGKDASQLLVIGAHYDSFSNSPGADDNASGVAVLLELARLLKQSPPPYPVLVVYFTNEEEPYFHGENMGSIRFVKEVLTDERRAYRMLSLESVGYYSKDPGSQSYPPPLNLLYYPVGDFVGFVSNLASRGFLKDVVFGFRQHSNFPTGASSLPEFLPGVTWSDQAAFWNAGKDAVMITDSALFRYPYYHTPEDKYVYLDYIAMTHLTMTLEKTLPLTGKAK